MENNQAVQSKPKNEATPQNSQNTSAGFMYEDLKLSAIEMLKNGVHFGHKISRWNPKMKPYVFGSRNGIHIIDLDKSLAMLGKALEYIKAVVSTGGKIMLVGTKPQARRLVEQAAKETEMPHVSNRWLGGTFTNFNEIKKRIRYLNSQEEKSARGEFEKYTKYEQGKIRKEIQKMNEKMGGIKKMESLPQAIFVVDVKEDNLAVKEARQMKIPVVAIVDTNNDPTLADFPIPANDDAVSALKYILGITAKEIKEAKSKIKTEPVGKQGTKKNKSKP
ncbi:MAG: 30S ribosomal protein S2 [Patescibacteria group bacterium]|nr:30S ribosomal protein S2 [Patescibacteria group bacterium]